MAKGWDLDPSVFAGLVGEQVGTRMRVIAVQLLNEIVMPSPVLTGRFRANNMVSLGAANYTTTTETDKDGTRTIQQGSAVIAKAKPYSVIYIQNNLPYAELLENGHSKQAPTGVYANAFNSVTQAYK
ncbi:HK97 gp10 family phage protein [Pectobacterium carotovorum]|uniref:HK97 gp10 family phage protein n=1 Tax=Pectobacterium carotovorum TaxID=554 RepID=UPI00301690D5